MKKGIILFYIFITISTAVSAGSIQQLLSENGFAVVNKVVPSINFKLENIDGIEEQLSDYRGKVVMLNFWATWCGPCRYEMPSMEKVYSNYKKDGLEIIAVNIGETAPEVRKFADEFGLTFPILLDKDTSVANTYGARSIPTTFLIDREGNILGMTVGAREWNSGSSQELFRELLK